MRHILSRELTEGELASYKAHPDAFFGVVNQAPKQANDPYELFQQMVDFHKEMPKERLLELCKDYSDAEGLATLDHLELVLELCERRAVAIAASAARERDAAEKAQDFSPEG